MAGDVGDIELVASDAGGDEHALASTDRTFAVLLGATTLLVLAFLAMSVARRHGQAGFYGPSDPRFFRLVAADPFGSGRSFSRIGFANEAAYRYGRIGLPLLAWLTVGGHRAWVGWSLVGVNLVAIAAVPLLAGLLLAQLGRDTRWAIVVLCAPGLLLVYDKPYAEPLAIAFVLGALLFDAREQQGAAIACLGYAVCTRETVALVVVAFVAVEWTRHRARATRWLFALLPYMTWLVWVRVRVGQFPFLAPTDTRRDALRLPFVGYEQIITARHSGFTPAVAVGIGTAVAALAVGAWLRRSYLGATCVALGIVVLTLGPNALRYFGETIRLLALPHVFVLLGAVIVFTRSTHRFTRSAS